jgi:hypothetical protein
MIFHGGGRQAEFKEMNAVACWINFTLEKRIPETQAGVAGLP